MSNFKLANQVRTKIASNDTAQAIELLNKALVNHPALNTILLRAGQHHGLREEVIRGTLSWENANLTQNQINHALLKVVDDLFSSFLWILKTPPTARSPSKVSGLGNSSFPIPLPGK